MFLVGACSWFHKGSSLLKRAARLRVLVHHLPHEGFLIHVDLVHDLLVPNLTALVSWEGPLAGTLIQVPEYAISFVQHAEFEFSRQPKIV